MKPSASILTTILLLSLLPTLSCRARQPKAEEPILVSAPDLLSEYLAASPDKVKQVRYSDRQLRVSGVLARVKSPEGLLILRGNEDPTTLNGVKCYLYGNDEDYHEIFKKMSQLVEGHVIVVQGHNRGFDFGFVELAPCTIKEY